MAKTNKVVSDYGKKYMLERDGAHFRLVATKEFWCGDYFVNRGSNGGLVDSPDNLSQDGSCWITKDACVYGNARIEGDALITDRAIVCADAIVRGKSIISDDCQVCGKSIVDGDSVVAGSIELVGVKLDGAMIKFCTKNGKLHINKYNQPNDLIIGIKTVVYNGKDKRNNEGEDDYMKRKFNEHDNTYMEYCRIVGK